MPTYDLRTEPWIPVHFLDGGHGAVGLRDALARAHEIREIALDNPMEISALYRLLLALTVRIFPETEEREEWFACWSTERFDPVRIDSYFEQWHDRFDLFHPERPFYQVHSNTGLGTLPVGLLRLDEGGNTSSLFSHDDLKRNATYTPDEAARGVVASQHAAIGGLLSNPYKTGNRNSPAIGGAIFWLCGANLFRSLLLNAPPDPFNRMGGYSEHDAPAWECDEPAVQEKRAHRGLLDYLTFQHRRITLDVEDTDAGAIVTGIRRTGGNAEEPLPPDDPHMVIINDEKTGPRRYNVQTGKAIWRDAPLYLTFASQRGTPPRTFKWAATNSPDLDIDRIDIEVFALRTRGANDGTIKLWRRERMPLFLNILNEPERGNMVVQALERADTQARNLAWATLLAASRLRMPGKEFKDLGGLDKEDAKKLARSIDTDTRYWAMLEAEFYLFLRELADASDPAADPDGAEARMDRWTGILHRTAFKAYDAATSSMDTTARQLRAVVEGRRAIRPAARYSTAETSAASTPTITT